MWVSSKVWHDAVTKANEARAKAEGVAAALEKEVVALHTMTRAKAEGVATALEKEVVALHTMNDWLRIRVEQVERERAKLIELHFGVKVEVPHIRAAVEATPEQILNDLPTFADVGDAVAEKLGISWNPDGTLAYK
jgi:hypothetical protein